MPSGGMFDPDDEEDEEYDLDPDEDELDDEDDDDEEDELDDMEDPRITELDDDDEEAPKLVEAGDKKKKTAIKQEKKGNKRPAEDDDEPETLDEMIASAANGEQKLSKKAAKKLKKNDGAAAAVKTEEKAEAPASTKSDKKVSFAKQLEQGPTPTKAKADADKEKPKGARVVQGVTIDDRKIGTGPAAKKGDRVGMRYIGKFLDGKVFDSNKKGTPFRFKIGSGEVIKGWDIGIEGMAVGGERRLTIPARLAYGKEKTPGIPPNSTLQFDVKLLEINKGK
jgi:FK506-binding nuclear protein